MLRYRSDLSLIICFEPVIRFIETTEEQNLHLFCSPANMLCSLTSAYAEKISHNFDKIIQTQSLSAGCAIGLGNVWKFPYICGKYGGAAFILIYLFFLLAFGLPMLVCEFSIGRSSRRSIAESYHVLEPEGSRRGWGWKNFMEEANTGTGLKFPDGLHFYVSYIMPLILIFIYLKGYYDLFSPKGTRTFCLWMSFGLLLLLFVLRFSLGNKKANQM